MSAFILFELEQWGEDEEDDDLKERKFLVKDLPAGDLWDIIGDEQGPFFDYIEQVEVGNGPTNGTIDQGGSATPDGSSTEWSISSSEIQDRDLFVQQTVEAIERFYGWKLEEV